MPRIYSVLEAGVKSNLHLKGLQEEDPLASEGKSSRKCNIQSFERILEIGTHVKN